MYRKKDFLLMQVYNTKGKKLGFINDILVDFNKEEVLGFSITSYRIFKSCLCVFKEDILAFNDNMVVINCRDDKLLSFKSIININVIGLDGNIIGVVEDMIFSEESFKIIGLVISTGYIMNFLYGKKIILLKDVIIGREHVLYYGDSKKLILSNIPKYKFKGKDYYEKKQ